MADKFVLLLSSLEIFSFGLLMPVLSRQLFAIGGNRFMLGALASLQSLLQFVTGPIFGGWSDNVGAKHALLVSAYGLLIGHLIFSVEHLYCFILGRILNACFLHGQILVKTLLAEANGEDQGGILAKQRALMGLSFTVSPIVGGIIMGQENGFSRLSLLNITLSIAYIGICHCIPRLERSRNRASINSNLWQVFANLQTIKWKTYGPIFMHRFLVETAASIHHQNLSYVFAEVFQSPPKEVGLIISFYGVCSFIVNLTMKRIRGFIAHGCETGSLGIAMSFVFLYFFPYYSMFIAFIVAFSVFKPLLNATWTEMLLSMTCEQSKGAVNGAFQALVQLAGFIAPLVNGFLAQMYGQSSSILLCIALAFFAAYVTTRMHKYKL